MATPVLAPSDDPYAALRLYEGRWRTVTPNDTAVQLTNRCAVVGIFFGCEQTVLGQAPTLILFIPGGEPGHYFTQGVTGQGWALGRGMLMIDGSHWVYSSTNRSDGKAMHYRTTNQFHGTDQIHFEQSESVDSVHWTVTRVGDETRVHPNPAPPLPSAASARGSARISSRNGP